jgi:hypothetical protein
MRKGFKDSKAFQVAIFGKIRESGAIVFDQGDENVGKEQREHEPR